MLLLLALAGCGGIRYSEVSPEAKEFHPKRIGVFPVDVGTYEEARGVIDQIIAGVLIDTKWFTDVVSADAINSRCNRARSFGRYTWTIFLNSELSTIQTLTSVESSAK